MRNFALKQEMDRREVLYFGLGVVTCASTNSADGQTSQTPGNSAVRNLKAVITINGTAFAYTMDGGKDLGNFSGPGFVQQNVRAVHPSPEFNPAFEVYFRPDVAPSTRVEAVFEFFKSGDLAAAVISKPAIVPLPAGVTAANILTHLTIEIFDGNGKPVADHLGRTVITAPTFWWGSRYRFQTVLRPTVKTPTQLVASKLIPPFGTVGLPGTIPRIDYSKYTYTNPMDLAGITASGGDTGERIDIGITTEIGSNYLIHPTDHVAQDAMLAWAEASATWPIHFRDDATGAPISKLKYPKANNFGWPKPDSSYQGSPCIWSGAAILNTTGQVQSGVTPDVAHLDSLSYVPFLSTGDSFHLEEQQFAANYVLIANNNGFNGNAVIGISGGARAVAWAIRTIFEAWSATKLGETYGPLPSWLMPSSYYDTLLKNMVPFFEQWTKSDSPSCKIFHFMPNTTGNIEPWENKYQATAFMLGVLVGRADYKEICEWVVQGCVDWISGRTGAPPAFPDPYYFFIGPGLVHDGTTVPNPATPASAFFPDLGTAFVAWAENDVAGKGGQISQAQLDALKADPLNGGILIQTQDDYVNYPRGVCALATYLNTLGLISMPDAPACLVRMNGYVQRLHQGAGYASARWAFQPSVDGSIPPFAPLPKPIPLPNSLRP